MNAVLLIAHQPLADALRQAVLHVFPDAAADIVALDVPPHEPPEATLQRARAALQPLADASGVLVLADVFGATPCNVAQGLCDGTRTRLVAGANLPALLRAVTYRHEPLESMLQRTIAGGTQGIMPVTLTAPHNQIQRTPHDQDGNHHQQ